MQVCYSVHAPHVKIQAFSDAPTGAVPAIGSAATRHFRSQAAAQLLKGEPHGLGMSATSEVPGPERLSMMRVCRRGVINSRVLLAFQV